MIPTAADLANDSEALKKLLDAPDYVDIELFIEPWTNHRYWRVTCGEAEEIRRIDMDDWMRLNSIDPEVSTNAFKSQLPILNKLVAIVTHEDEGTIELSWTFT